MPPLVQALVDRQPLPRDQRRERSAGDVFHRNEIEVVVLAEVENRDDIRMIEAGGRSRFLDETLLSFAVDRLVAGAA
jgi:hypothetical protein